MQDKVCFSVISIELRQITECIFFYQFRRHGLISTHLVNYEFSVLYGNKSVNMDKDQVLRIRMSPRLNPNRNINTVLTMDRLYKIDAIRHLKCHTFLILLFKAHWNFYIMEPKFIIDGMMLHERILFVLKTFFLLTK